MKPWLVPLVIILALAGLAFWAKQHQTEPQAAIAIECRDPVSGCGFVYRGQQAQLRFSAVPKPMEAFSVELYAPAARKVSAQFQMAGMEMGFNRYDFRAGQHGLFKAEAIILPVCTQARSDWVAEFTLDSQPYRFTFQAR